ncbi:MAG: alpha/beta hydrolase [Pirellulaceae bacterium]|jgi:hypothetical protein|nr:alpha/beta hydrolase [Pirellulaceae bacterium]
MTSARAGLVSAVLVLLLLAVGNASEPTRLDPFQLLEFRGEDGAVHPVTSGEQWQLRRAQIVAGMQRVMGTWPAESKTPLDVQIVEQADAGSYVRRLITYQSDPGCRTPAYLCIPKDVLAGSRPAPAALCLHPTDQAVGHQVVVGLGGRAGRSYAAELAARGYVTIAPSYPLLAKYWPALEQLGYLSGTMKAMWDNHRAIDVLSQTPGVELGRGVAAIGHSLGGHNAIFTAVFEPRISVVVTSCGFDSFGDYYDGAERNWFYGQGWCQLRYMPHLSDYRGRLKQIPFDFPELLAAIAPRMVFINAPLHDDNFRATSVDRCVTAARTVFELLGHSERLIVRHPDCGHDFPDAVREETYRVIDTVLMPQ